MRQLAPGAGFTSRDLFAAAQHHQDQARRFGA
jgi:hypothetical protein